MCDFHLYLVHPLLPSDDIKRLGVKRLSDIVKESLVQNEYDSLKEPLSFSTVCSAELVPALNSLLLNRHNHQQQYQQQHVGTTSHFSSSYITSLLDSLVMYKVEELLVSYELSVSSPYHQKITLYKEQRLCFVDQGIFLCVPFHLTFIPPCTV